MKIELKKISFSERMSEETNCFTADLYINGIKAGYVRNDGCGGSTDYYANEGKRKLIEEAEKFCVDLPSIKYGRLDIQMNLENKIDQLFEEWLKSKDEEKLQKKLQKDMTDGLCIKTNLGYEKLTWKSGKNKVTIAQMIRAENGKKMLRDTIVKVKSEGKEILNTNIPQELFQ